MLTNSVSISQAQKSVQDKVDNYVYVQFFLISTPDIFILFDNFLLTYIHAEIAG